MKLPNGIRTHTVKENIKQSKFRHLVINKLGTAQVADALEARYSHYLGLDVNKT